MLLLDLSVVEAWKVERIQYLLFWRTVYLQSLCVFVHVCTYMQTHTDVRVFERLESRAAIGLAAPKAQMRDWIITLRKVV